MSETQLVRAVLDALAAKRVWAWRCNSGALILGRGTSAERFLRGAPKGSPDVLGVVPGSRGQLFGIECKSPTGKQNANQKQWELRAEQHHVRYGVARSVSDALELIEAWRRD